MADIRIRWVLDVVDRGAGKDLLKQDRAIRRGLEQTDRQYKKTATTAASAAARQASASQKLAGSVQREGRAAVTASDEVRRYAAAQREALTIGSRLAAQAGRTEQAYRRQARGLADLNRAQRTAAATAKRAGSGAVAAGAAGARLSRGAAGSAVGLAGAAGLGLGFAAAARDATTFEQSMANVSAKLLTSQKNMRELSDFAVQLGAKTQFSAGQAADAMGELAASGFSAREIFKTLRGTLDLAAASGTDLASAAEIQAAALRGFGLQAKQAGHVADVLAQTSNKSAVEMSDLGETLPYVASTARQTGTSFEQVAAAAGILGNAGIKGSRAGTALRTSMLRLTDPTNKMAGIFEDLGIKASQLSAVPLPRVIGLIADRIKDLPRGRQVGIVSAIFGKEAAPSLLNLMAQGKTRIDRLTDSLVHSQGAARRAAGIMRSTVSGAWDNFTGSVETSAITLTRRFMPAIRVALNSAAGGVNRATAAIGRLGPQVAAGVGTGLRGQPAQGALARTGGGAGAVERVDPSRAAQIGARIGQVARTVGLAAATAGKQLLDAFRPALPFFRNVLLPLLQGVGKGVLGSVVGAFRVLVPVIRVTATVLGAVGTKARPLRGFFQGIGTVIGFVAAGPILKLVSGLGKVSVVFRLLAAPIRLISGLVGGVIRVFGRFSSTTARAFSGLLTITKPAVTAVARVAGVFGSLPHKIASAVRGKLGDLLGFFGRVGKAIVGAVVNAIKAAPGAIKNAITSVVPGPVKGALRKIGLRRGGRVRRYGSGGLVDAMVSPGEAIVYGNSIGLVPGRPEPRDSVPMSLPVGAAVLTSDGQRRLAAGSSMASVLANQAPHFRAGGVVTGRYTSTAYGPPWGGIQGTGTTATGVNLRRGPHVYGVAVDPSMIRLGSQVYAWPNPFGRTGPFRAFDTGGAIKGRRVDFYDWRGRRAQTSWGRRPVTISTSSSHAGGSGGPSGTGDVTARVPIIFGRSRTRAGLLDDALRQGIDAGASGLTRAEINRGVLGARGARTNPILAAIRGAQTATSRDVNVPGAGAGGGGGSASSWSRRQTFAWARAFARRWGLRITSSYRDPARNRAAGGVEGSLHTRGTPGNPHAFDFTPPKPAALAALRRLRPRVAEAMIHNAGSGLHLHAGLFRRGGIIGRYRAGGRVGAVETPGAGGPLTAAANRVTTFAAGTFQAMDAAIGRAAEVRLNALRRALVARVRRGGDAKIVQRLRGVIDLIDFEVGRRIGRLQDAIARRSARLERRQGAAERLDRRAGIDPDSVGGLMRAGLRVGLQDIPTAEANARSARSVLARAKRTGNREVIRQAQEDLNAALDAVDEAFTRRAEIGRQLIAATAQQRVDAAQFGLDQAQGGLAGLDVAQRLNRSADTPGGMVARAQAIQSQLLPALQGSLEALQAQQEALASIGDLPGSRQAALAVQQAGNDIASAMADAADLVRQAALQAAQDTVDTAASGTTLAQLGEQRLELEQRIAGTSGSTGARQEIADYITRTIIPALDAELAALRTQAQTAAEQGDPVLARQIAEGIAGKENEKLQAIVDATEATAENTEPLKEFAGTLAGEYRGEQFTDRLLGFAVGT